MSNFNYKSKKMDTKENKKSKLYIDDSYDLQLVSKLHPALRWVLMLPIGFLAILLVQLAYGFVFNKLLSNFDTSSVFSIIVNSIFMAMKYCVFVVAMVGVAPVIRAKKFPASIACAFIAVIVCLGSTFFLFSKADSVDWPMLIATGCASLLGIIWASWNVRSVTSRPLTTTQEDDGPKQ